MKYAIVSCIALAACLVVSWVVVGALGRRRGRMLGLARHLILSGFCAFFLLGASLFAYFSVYYHADSEALAALDGDDPVHVRQADGTLFFDGPGQNSAVVFFPGAKVQAEAYAPLLRSLALQGVDCFLVCPLGNFAPLGMGAAEAVLEGHEYTCWLACGHSLGGTTAASFASTHDEVRAVILLAAYPTKALPGNTALLSVYGSQDTVLERQVYENARSYWPAESSEIVIEGGNHAGYAYYGAQKGDGVASITPSEQQSQTVAAIVSFVESLERS